MKAAGALKEGQATRIAVLNLREGRPVASSQIQKLVAQNASALKLMRQGFEYECRYPRLEKFPEEMPNFAGLHELAYLFVLESEWKFRSGDKAGGVSASLDSIKLGIAYQHGAYYAPFLTGIAFENIGRFHLLSHIQDLDAKTARAAVLRLEELARQRAPLAQALREDVRMGQVTLPSIIRHMDEKDETELQPYTEQIVTNYSRWMDALVADLDKPYTQRRKVAIPVDMMNQHLLPTYQKVGLNEARNIAGHNLLLVIVALQAYKSDHGRYPADLKALAGSYLPAIPIDPFSDNQPLRYERTDKKYKLYSLGPDGIDNKGVPIRPKVLDEEMEVEQPGIVSLDSKGDFVMGINY